ncbi:hypothetical protein NDA13_001840 [Ustilago tritici]|nr:hypothetical protein NDA13_001840 [Ustilago tritici]
MSILRAFQIGIIISSTRQPRICPQKLRSTRNQAAVKQPQPTSEVQPFPCRSVARNNSKIPPLSNSQPSHVEILPSHPSVKQGDQKGKT